MRRIRKLCLCMTVVIGITCPFLFARLLNAQSDVYATPEAARANPDFGIQGEYSGEKLGLQVIARGNGDFELVSYPGGLPGEGWDRNPAQRAEGDVDTVRQFIESKNLKRVDRTSPTLGAKPPVDAVVLFDGSQQSVDAHWQSGARLTDDGLLKQGGTTKDTFTDYTLHIEFRTPFEPSKEGQLRGNSGVYHQGRYETQVLDSFGLAGKNNETGGIYEVRDPDLNMCFPPLAWQTYDVEFTAPRFDATGKKTSDAKLTVRLNGVVVQRDVPVPAPTRAAPLQEANTPGPIYIQDHGNEVRYRNIWIQPRDADKEARRPIVPGYERFLANETLGGRLLIEQLGCGACHESTDSRLVNKSAPILDHVGSRIRMDHLVALTSNPHDTKTGTMMPDLFHDHDESQRITKGLAIASFLATTGSLVDRPGDSNAIRRGEELFHTIGCVACHQPRKGNDSIVSTSIPLGDITSKYSLDGLSTFLVKPHVVRPSGEMPRLVNTIAEARDIACYLIGEQIVAPGKDRFTATVYHGTWEKLPDFERLESIKTVMTQGLDLNIAGRKDNFGIRFETYLPIPVAGEYTFYLKSDDGSRLLIDQNKVIDHDGVHGPSEKSGKRRLDAGVHTLRIDFFEATQGEVLELDMESSDVGRTPISILATSDPSGFIETELIPSRHRSNASLVEYGRALFVKTGCANCHALKIDDTVVASELKAPALNTLKPNAGCLAPDVPNGLPKYDLSQGQRASIVSALTSLANELDNATEVHFRLTSMNCYACHARGSVGGAETTRDPWFTTKMQEMGNEGRVPPSLTGVGDKLKPEVMEQIIAKGSKDRPYMVTRMPAFGESIATSLRKLVVTLDTRERVRPQIDHIESEAANQLVSTGRKLVGSEGLACIKCHTFNGKATPGIQAIDMIRMSERLREDWFHRYLLAPTEYRPGTRMPLSFPEGKSVLTSVMEGNADKQIDAMWLYLSQGKDARTPIGVDAQAIVLVPDSKPVIYRNFIQGLGTRGIAIGYPEKVNLAWDAGNMNVALLWKNEFIDASLHWLGRGPGAQSPLGDSIVKFESTSPLAILSDPNEPWPTKSSRERGYSFKGYSLDEMGRPSFRYAIQDVQVVDKVVPISVTRSDDSKLLSDCPGVHRSLTITSSNPANNVMFRAARGAITLSPDGSFRIDNKVSVRVEGIDLNIVSIGDKQELRGLLPANDTVTIQQTILW